MKIELSDNAQLRMAEITEYYLLNESIERTVKIIYSFDTCFGRIADNPYQYKKYIPLNLSMQMYVFTRIIKPIISTLSSINIPS